MRIYKNWIMKNAERGVGDINYYNSGRQVFQDDMRQAFFQSSIGADVTENMDH